MAPPILYKTAFITQQLAVNEKLKMLEEGREGKSKGGGIGKEKTGSNTTKRVNCERDSEVRDGARESERA